MKNDEDNRKYYISCPPYEYSTYSPWLKEDFQEIYDKIRNNTVVKEDRCYILNKFSEYCTHLKGDFAECGVYKGGTAYLIANTLKKNSIANKNLLLFDTFKGFPASANEDPGVIKKQTKIREGTYGDVSLDDIKNYLKQFTFVKFHPGLIPATFENIKSKKFAFVHVDVDLYQPAYECCKFFYDKIVSGGIIIFDDYGFPEYMYSEKKAVDDFFSDKVESPISLRTGQCLIIKV